MRGKAKRFVKRVWDLDRYSHLTPIHSAITGSHIYGFSDDTSDIDIRGFHVAPDEDFLCLNQPQEQIEINQNTDTYEFQDFEDIDFVSYELRKFGKLLYKTNFNVIELITDGITVHSRQPRSIASLKELIKDHLPGDIPRHYWGMAKHNYHKYVDSKYSESYKPIAKKYLYVIRGLLGAIYTTKFGTVEPKVEDMAEELLGDTIVDDVIAFKKARGNEPVPKRMRRWCNHLIDHLFKWCKSLDFPEKDKKRLRTDIDEWMLQVRNKV